MAAVAARRATSRHWFGTGLGLHRIGRRWAMAAVGFGLTVEYRHDGGWLWREHMLVVRGPAKRVTLFATYLETCVGDLGQCVERRE